MKLSKKQLVLIAAALAAVLILILALALRPGKEAAPAPTAAPVTPEPAEPSAPASPAVPDSGLQSAEEDPAVTPPASEPVSSAASDSDIYIQVVVPSSDSDLKPAE